MIGSGIPKIATNHTDGPRRRLATATGAHPAANRFGPSARGLLLFTCTVTCSLALLIQGCALVGGEQVIPAAQRSAYDGAVGRIPSDPQGATGALESFLAAYPTSLLADDAKEQLAQLALAGGRQQEGMRWLSRVFTDHPDSDRAPSARLRLAQLEYGQDDRVAARRLLGPLDLSRLELPDQRAALRLRAALARSPIERLEALSLLRRTLVAEANARGPEDAALARLRRRLENVDRDIGELIRRAATAELEAISIGRAAPAGRIALELVRRALDAGQLDLATTRLERADGFELDALEAGELRVLRDRLARLEEFAAAEADLPPLRALVDRPRPRTDDARGTLGVVLPLSGEFADYGQKSLRGILLATGLFEPDETERPAAEYPDRAEATSASMAPRPRGEIRLVVRDSRGDPARAAAAVRELARDPDLLAIVGPIFSAESIAAAEAAEVAGIPLVALSTREDLAVERSQSFRTRTRPSDEVGALVNHAFDVLDAKRFAVLYPESKYGRGMRRLYWQAVTARGGKMVAASSYDPGSVDFAGAIRDMIGYRFLTDWERKALDERAEILRASRVLEPADQAMLREVVYSLIGPEKEPLPPIVDFDVLFIPDAGAKVELIAPGLAFHEIRGVTLLGSNDWLDPELLRVAGRHVAGAVVSTPFYMGSDVPFVAEFVDGYRKTFDAEPDSYAAEAYDATNIVLVQMSSGRRGREGIRAGLLDLRAYPGAAGVMTMHPDGNARRRPFLLRVSGRRFSPLD